MATSSDINRLGTDEINENEEFDAELTEKRLGSDKFTSRQWRSLMFIILTYICLIPNRTFIASIATTLKDDPDIEFSNTTYGTLAIIAGLAYAFGKAFDGILIDGRFCFKFMNEVKSMYLFLIISCISVFLFSFGDSFTFFVIVAIPNSIVQAGTWPSLAKLIYTIYEPAQFGRVFALMGVASKVGSTLARLYIGLLLIIFDDWRWAVRAVSFLGIFGVLVFAYFATFRLKEDDQVWFAFPYYSKLKEFFHINTFDSFMTMLKDDSNGNNNGNNNNNNNNNNENNSKHNKGTTEKKTHVAELVNEQLKCRDVKNIENSQNEQVTQLKSKVLKEISEDIDSETIVEKYGRLIFNRRFLLIGFSVMCLTVLVGVEGFSDLLIDDVLNVSTNGYVTIVSACLPAGIVCALLTSHFVVRKYQPSMQQSGKFVVWSLIVVIFISLAILIWIWVFYNVNANSTSETIGLTTMGLLLFCFGFLLAYPYYVPPGVFSLRYGGRDSGTVNALLDLFGFLFVAPFSYGGSALSEISYGWGWVWITMYVPISIACVFFYYAFNKYNLKSEKRQELLMKRIEAEIDILTKGFMNHQATIEMESPQLSDQE